MNELNHLLCNVFDFICGPLASWGAWWGLAGSSVLTGIIMLFIFRLTSDQAGIAQVKNRIKAYLLEARLYNDDLGLMLEAQRAHPMVQEVVCWGFSPPFLKGD